MFWPLLLSVQLSFSAPASHLVTNLPYAPAYNFNIYSGYLNVSNGKQLHYMFYTSQQSTNLTDPVVLWLNGGPGCSSLEGAFMENGALIFSEYNNTMYANPYSWNRVANMLYFESPAGVGYSYMGSVVNNYTNDNITASDNLLGLQAWYTLFPEYKTNKFYIAGESYAGVYIPFLASYIQTWNQANPGSPINLQGFMAGNPVTDWSLDSDATWPSFLYWHQLIDDSIYWPWVNLNCSMDFPSNFACYKYLNQMYNLFTEVNYYDIYRECIPADPMMHRQRWKSENLGGVSNCVPNNAMTWYLNLPKVRNALHINTTLGSWEGCSDIDYQVNLNLGSYFLYPGLVNSGIRINVYSGDTDSCVATEGTRAWINKLVTEMPLTAAVNWTEWMLNGQVGGFYTRYGPNFRFNTIRGAGHMCIQWLPAQGFQMFSAFLNGTDLAN
jgi:carboxypeptidase C (cathepsin A)